jgi:UDP-N-acetylglucosamine--dolichyl-phosphate N-acetylglucosaminephosphotransferase
MNPLLFLAIAIAFLGTLFFTMKWIPVAKKVGLVGKDANKYAKPEVAEMGGVAVLAGILGGALFYIGLNTFVLNQTEFNLALFATLSTVMIIAFVGIIDDFLGWKVGLSQLQKPLLTIPAALPMMVINAGHSSISLPFIGDVNLGILYPLLFVPIGIIGASNGFNMLAGYNGLEAGMGLIIISGISLVAYTTGSGYVAMLGAIAAAALAAFLVFNWYPAKIFPGNTLTYMIGAIIACLAILANVEKLALVAFIPYFIDFALKARSRMKAEEFGKAQPDGALNKPYDKYYGLPHVMIDAVSKIKGKAYERDVVLSIFLIEAVCVAAGYMLYL